MDKTVVQRVFEYVASAGRDVTTREVLGAFPESKASAITFSLSRLVRAGELQRKTHGTYVVGERSDPADATPLLEDPYILHILERIRPVLEFVDLAYVHAALDAGRSAVPAHIAKLARSRAKDLKAVE